MPYKKCLLISLSYITLSSCCFAETVVQNKWHYTPESADKADSLLKCKEKSIEQCFWESDPNKKPVREKKNPKLKEYKLEERFHTFYYEHRNPITDEVESTDQGIQF